MSILSRLRKVGGSVMVSIPPALLQSLDLKADDLVDVSLLDGVLKITPKAKPVYALDALLAQCDATAPLPDQDKDWIDGSAHGQELI